jgi:hypothetical protein
VQDDAIVDHNEIEKENAVNESSVLKKEVSLMKSSIELMAAQMSDLNNNLVEMAKSFKAYKSGNAEIDQNNVFLTQVMFKDKNLIKVPATQYNKYITQLMTILFSDEELKNGLIIDGKSISKRIPLDPERVQLLKGTI